METILQAILSSDWLEVILAAIVGAAAVSTWLLTNGERAGYWLGRFTKGEAIDRAIDKFLTGFLEGLRKTYKEQPPVDVQYNALGNGKTEFKLTVKDTPPFSGQ